MKLSPLTPSYSNEKTSYDKISSRKYSNIPRIAINL